MHWFLVLSIVLNWIIAAVWSLRALAARHNFPQVPNLLDERYASPPAAASHAPQITVIVPARDEAATIEATLRSLLAQTVPVEILAVDDRSTDATGALMERVAAEARAAGKLLSVLHIDALPEGWMGKTHAMALAARQTATPWLLFTDGDILFREDTLARALAFARASSSDHVVLFPTLILKSMGECMMAAVFYALSLLAWRPWKIADPNAKGDFTGVGAFNLVRSDAYRAVGGFEAWPLEVIEDVRLGFAIKQSGYRQHMVFGRGLIRVHWAAGVLGMIRNLTKNIFSLFRFRALLLLGASLGLALLCFAPLAGLFGSWPVRVPSLLALAMIALLYRLSSRYVSGISALYVFMFPLAAALVLYAVLRSMIVNLFRGGIVWRGTFYPLRELRRHAAPWR